MIVASPHPQLFLLLVNDRVFFYVALDNCEPLTSMSCPLSSQVIPLFPEQLAFPAGNSQ
jgi:hypothetical protein